MKMSIMAIRKGWELPEKTKDHMKARLDEVLENPQDQNILLGAIRLGTVMERDDVDRVVKLTTLDRLVNGESTENVIFKFVDGVKPDDV